MDNNDKKQFLELINSISGLLQKDPLNEMALNLFFNLLTDYTYEQVEYAVGMHLKSSTGQFMVKPADIIKHLSIGQISHEEVISEARLKITPFGVMAAMKIGSWNLDNLNNYELKAYAQEVIHLLPGWQETKAKGNYTDHEMLILMKYDVNPSEPFMNGLPVPDNISDLRIQYSKVKKSDQYIEMISKKESIDVGKFSEVDGVKVLGKLVNKLNENGE